MIPETTENKGFSKRALLPFVGDFSKSIFGIATENDIRVLAGHINALTRQQNKNSTRTDKTWRRPIIIYKSGG
jgi:hypothetical protein